MDKKAQDTMYAYKKAYVETILRQALEPVRDFDQIKYARDPITNEEFIKLTEDIGSVWYINVTGSDESEILKAVLSMLLERRPEGLVTVRDRQRDASRLFK